MISRHRAGLIVPLMVAQVSCVTTPEGEVADSNGLSPAGAASITSLLDGYVEDGKLAGVVAVVAQHGQVVYAQSAGWMDLEQQIPMQEDAIFRIYSMTKPVVAAGVLKLVEQRMIALEDPVAKYIPAFSGVRVHVGGSADAPVLQDPDSVMRIRHLLTHTAGLGYGLHETPVDTLYRRAALFDPVRTVEEFADSIARLPLYFTPGTRFNYSAAIDVAGRVIEVASGLPLDRFLYEEIFLPLRMGDTSFRIRADMRGRVAVLYALGEDGRLGEVTDGLLAMYEPDARFFWGGGGLLSTTRDYLRFAQMLLNGGHLDGVRILADSSVALMMRNHLPPTLTPLTGPPLMDGGYGYGLGGAVLVDTARAQLPGPSGIYRWSGYVGTYFWIDPVNEVIAMVWTQLTPGRMWPLEEEFQRVVYGALR
ncbi:MAG TPA: serine hydrolase domain-containing protein [Longimicrobiales bacterium]|nr:serine hydrolase domain-containing protein [Longimicrobiales bacterium]